MEFAERSFYWPATSRVASRKKKRKKEEKKKRTIALAQSPANARTLFPKFSTRIFGLLYYLRANLFFATSPVIHGFVVSFFKRRRIDLSTRGFLFFISSPSSFFLRCARCLAFFKERNFSFVFTNENGENTNFYDNVLFSSGIKKLLGSSEIFRNT